MRTMLRVTMGTEASNLAVKEGPLPKLVQQTIDLIQPEAMYFTSDRGDRTGCFFFDLRESSLVPQVAGPWFSATHAKIDFQPVMTGDEPRAGLEKLGK